MRTADLSVRGLIRLLPATHHKPPALRGLIDTDEELARIIEQAMFYMCAGPAQVAVAIKTAIAALEGQVVPQSIRLPLAKVNDPDFKDGDNFYQDQSDNFFVGNSFPTCGINFSAQEIMGQSETDQ